jgi:rhamnogalacturonyl hydrolase YesR
MKKYLNIIFTLSLAMILVVGCSKFNDGRTAEEIGVAVAEKIISESVFELETVIQNPVQNIQVLDFKNQFGDSADGTFYSISGIVSASDTALLFGVSFSGRLSIYINNTEVFSGINVSQPYFKEIAYNMFVFQDSAEFKVNKGRNSILIELEKMTEQPVVFLREIPDHVDDNLSADFELNYLDHSSITDQWLNIGPFQNNKMKDVFLSGQIMKQHEFKGTQYYWQLLKENKLKELVIPESNSYRRESYLEWHYANGTVLFGMQSLSDALEVEKYSDFAEKAIGFTVNNYELFKHQYENLHAFRGSNHRMFRKTMLDDTGAPALPYLNYYLISGDEKVKFIIDEMNEYVSHHQVRLDDGTFCRPEPTRMSLWADDLFMSVPFLVRMGKLTGDSKYFDDAALQIMNFNNYLFDEEIGLYKHGWFEQTGERSIAFWGRANGWVVWAVTEALLNIPRKHKDYEKIVNLFKVHIDGLLNFQSDEGMWHQVINKPESFKETSCTAMYIIGILRGVENGWLPDKYKENAVRAWNELKSKIAEDGTVKDICRGTGIGFDLDFYYERARFDNDPRGLGAVLTAVSEIIKAGYQQ